MATEAQIRANNKYRDKTYDRVEVTVPKGTKERWRALAEQEGKSLNAYIVSRVEGAYVHAEEIVEGEERQPQESPASSSESPVT